MSGIKYRIFTLWGNDKSLWPTPEKMREVNNAVIETIGAFIKLSSHDLHREEEFSKIAVTLNKKYQQDFQQWSGSINGLIEALASASATNSGGPKLNNVVAFYYDLVNQIRVGYCVPTFKLYLAVGADDIDPYVGYIREDGTRNYIIKDESARELDIPNFEIKLGDFDDTALRADPRYDGGRKDDNGSGSTGT
jgi:hypothetical protein